MRLFILVLFVTLIPSCSNDKNDYSESAINEIRKSYVNGWLAGDKETVLALFSNDATIIPDGMEPINGLEAIENYWFPNDSSSTIIHSYEVELIDVDGTDSMAYSLEKGVLNFTYTKEDFTMTKESTSHATTVYIKDKSGSWKIISRMWTQLK